MRVTMFISVTLFFYIFQVSSLRGKDLLPRVGWFKQLEERFNVGV